MTNRDLYIAGTGTFAAEVIEFARAAGWRVAGLVEPIDPERVGTVRHGLPVGELETPPQPGAAAVVGLGPGRPAVADRLEARGWRPVSIVHPTAVVSPSATVGEGVVVGPLVVVGAESRIDDHALLGRGVLVGHHTTIGRGAVLNPGANVAGLVDVGAGATIGMGASVADRRVVGTGAVVAAGAVVVRDVEPATRVQGVPARPFVAGAA